jgi:mRNA-degrading endonuclease RelE of RelBE toxin-antitoxin system
MSFDVKYSPVFERAIKRLAKKYPSVRGDLELLITELAEDPHKGTALGGVLPRTSLLHSVHASLRAPLSPARVLPLGRH